MKKIAIILLSFTFTFAGCTKKDLAGDKTQDASSSEKVLNLHIQSKVKGLDPIEVNDRYTSHEVSMVYEGLMQYHYLKRPYEVIPSLAKSYEVSADNTVYTFKLKQGVLFHDNECFPGGKGREMTAEDFVFSFKRLADPQLNSPAYWLVQDRIKGVNAWREKNKSVKTPTDYSQNIEGIQAIDKYTVQFTLVKPYPQFLYALAYPATFVTPKEAVDKYGKELLNHPVGTGPFITGTYDQGNKIVYYKNPKYRDEFYPSDGTAEDKKNGMLKDAGKKLPLVDKVVAHIIVESQPHWLNYLKGKIDVSTVPKDNYESTVNPDKTLKDEFKNKGMGLKTSIAPDIRYYAFNNSLELFKNQKLRQAMAMAVDSDEVLELFFNGRGATAQGPIPPGIAGYIPDFKNPYRQKNVEKAKALLAEAGYPEGKGLPAIEYEITSSTTGRQGGELFKKHMSSIGVKVQLNTNTWPELSKKVRTGSAMMYGMGWSADYPDAENFLQLYYGPNKSPGANGSNYDDPVFNAMYEKATVMSPSTERTKLYEEMAMYIAEKVPVIFGTHVETMGIYHAWVNNYQPHDFRYHTPKYYNIDMTKKQEWISKL